MKKLSRLMLIGLPFLAFSGVSFGDDTNQIDNSKDSIFVKLNAKATYYTYYMQSDDQPAVPANAAGNTIVIQKHKLHLTTFLNEKLEAIGSMYWKTEGKHPIIVSFEPATDKDASKTDATVSQAGDDSVNVNVSDKPTPSSDQPANKEEPAITGPSNQPADVANPPLSVTVDSSANASSESAAPAAPTK